MLKPITKIEDIEKAVEQLSPADLAKFRKWFGKFDARAFDEKIERDAKSGKLDKLVAEGAPITRPGGERNSEAGGGGATRSSHQD